MTGPSAVFGFRGSPKVGGSFPTLVCRPNLRFGTDMRTRSTKMGLARRVAGTIREAGRTTRQPRSGEKMRQHPSRRGGSRASAVDTSQAPAKVPNEVARLGERGPRPHLGRAAHVTAVAGLRTRLCRVDTAGVPGAHGPTSGLATAVYVGAGAGSRRRGSSSCTTALHGEAGPSGGSTSLTARWRGRPTRGLPRRIAKRRMPGECRRMATERGSCMVGGAPCVLVRGGWGRGEDATALRPGSPPVSSTGVVAYVLTLC